MLPPPPPSPLFPYTTLFRSSLSPCAMDFRYRAPDPLGETLNQVTPGLDGFITEVYAAEIEAELARWAEALASAGRGGFQTRPYSSVMRASLAETFEAFDPAHAREEPVRNEPDLTILRRRFSEARVMAPDSFLQSWENDLNSSKT